MTCDDVKVGKRPLTDAERATVAENYALCLWAATRHQGMYKGLDPDHLLGAAHLALVRAAKTHTPEKGTFATHFMWWFRSYVSREIRRHRHMIDPPFGVDGRHKRVGLNSDTRRLIDEMQAARQEAESRDSERRASDAARLNAAVSALPESHAEIIRSHWLDERSYAEIARDEGVSRRATQQRGQRAIARLRRRLKGDAA